MNNRYQIISTGKMPVTNKKTKCNKTADWIKNTDKIQYFIIFSLTHSFLMNKTNTHELEQSD